MDWRLIVAGSVVSAGLIVGWVEFGTFTGAFLSALFVLGLFIVNWIIDQHIYDR